MKLTAVILWVICLMAGLKGEAQTVSLKLKDAKLGTVLKRIKQQTGYSFFYNEAILAKAARVSLDIKNEPISRALQVCFDQQPVLRYAIVDKTVVITERDDNTTGKEQLKTDTLATGTRTIQGITIRGTVFNKRLDRLASASVMVKGTQRGALTQADGSFQLSELKPDDLLRVSFIGYKTQELAIRGKASIQVILEDASNELDEVVAQGYSKTTKRLSTSSVSKVSSAEIERQPVLNPLLALQGRVPGMVLTPLTGYEAGPIKMDIRGISSISNPNSNPLIIVDGTPLTMGINSSDGPVYGEGPVQGFAGSVSPAKSQSPLFGLNPLDIESIEILKDISSTAIYGSSGANGVILITTKRGKAGPSQFNVNANTGISKITRYWDVLNTPQYLEMRREAFRNDGVIPTVENAPDLVAWDSTRYTDWQKVFWGRSGKRLGVNASLTGGIPQFTHRLSASYNRFEDITTSSGASEALGVTLSLDRKSQDNKFMTSLTVGYNYTKMDMINIIGSVLQPPNAPPIFDKDGNLNYKEYSEVGQEDRLLFAESMLRPVDSRVNSLTANLKLAYQAFKGFTVSTNIGYRHALSNISYLGPIISMNPMNNPTGEAVFSKTISTGWIAEPQVNYDTRLLGLGRLRLLAGATLKQSGNESVSDMAMGFTNDALLRNLASAAFVMSSNSSAQYKFAGVRGSAEFVWDNKYIGNFTASRDGSSRFGPGNRFGNFWAAGVAWIASDEPWFKNEMPAVLNFVKLRGNYGTSGNDGGADYKYMSRWGRGNTTSLPNYDGVVPFLATQPVNQSYQWQVSKEFTVGLEMRFLKNGNLVLDIAYYNRRSGNQLTENPTPIFTGFPSVFGNWNALVSNTGWEFTLNAQVIGAKNFSWSVYANGGFNTNKLLRYPSIENSPHYSRYLVGASLQTRYLMKYMGIDPMTGNYKFEDYNQNGKLDNRIAQHPPLSGFNDMGTAMGMLPKFTGGFGTNLRYKNLSLNAAFDLKVQKGVSAFASVQMPGTMQNIPLEIFNNRWQKPGDQSRYAKFTTATATTITNWVSGGSTLAYTDASFLRLTNIAFSYSLANGIAWRKFKLKGLAFNIMAQNLFVITRYEGIDPETQTFGQMPPAKVISAGLSLTF